MSDGDDKRPWHQRFLYAISPMPNRVWALWFVVMLVLIGVMIGASWCTWRATAPLTSASQPAPLQLQIDLLEQRVRPLEQRAAPPAGGPR